MEHRQIDIIPYKDLTSEILHPERLSIQLDKNIRAHPFDVGRICYTNRQNYHEMDYKTGTMSVKLDMLSFKSERRELVRNIVDHLILRAHTQLGLRTKLTCLIRVIGWLDTNQYEAFCHSKSVAQQAYKGYTEYLRHRILALNNLTPTTASTEQRTLLELIEIQFGRRFRNYTSSLTFRIFEEPHSKETELSKTSVKEYLTLFLPLIRSLAKTLMHDNYPFLISYSKYEAVFFPHATFGVKSPFHNPKILFYDFEKRAVKDTDEIFQYMKKANWKSPTLSYAKRTRRKLLYDITISNKNKQNCLYRSLWSQKVIKGYATIIGILTGANPTQIVEFEYNEALELLEDSIKKELSGIKLRAKGKTVRYPIGGKKGIKLLKEYIEFREWHLNGRTCKYLFFKDHPKNSRSNYTNTAPKKLRLDFNSGLIFQLKKSLLPPDFVNITFSLARKYKSLILHELKIPTSVVSDNLNHTANVNAKYYQDGLVETKETELGYYWDSVQKACQLIDIRKKKITPTIKSTTVGHCKSKGKPSPTHDTPPIAPDCSSQYGCLYCKHYICHADEEDVWKLLSLKYVLKEIRETSASYERADELFQDLCLRVDAILEKITEIGVREKNLVENMLKKVNDLGILTPFWDKRLTRYESLGLTL